MTARPALERWLDLPQRVLGRIFKPGSLRDAAVSMVELSKQAIRSRRNRRERM